MKTKTNGDAKVAIDNIEKGILSDGLNFKTDDNIIEVGGENQPSLEGVENFLVELSDYVFKENSGMYISGEGQEEISAVYIDEYKGNTERRAKTSIRLDRIGNAKPRTHFHTHLSSFKDNDKYQPSKKDFSVASGRL